LENQSEPSTVGSPKLKDARLALMDAFSFPEIKSLSALKINDARKQMIDKLKNNHIVAEDAPKEYFETVEKFLLPKRIVEQYFRLKLANSELSFPKKVGGEAPIPQGHACEVFLTVYPSIGAVILLLNIELSECDVDDLIMLEQSQFGANEINVLFGDESVQPRKMSLGTLVTEYIKPILQAFNPAIKNPSLLQTTHAHARCAELCGFSNYKISNPELMSEELMLNELCKPLYGLLTSDEGWRFVPVETAKDRMQLRWQTRDFFDVIAFEETVVVINLEQCVHERYIESQKLLRNQYDHKLEPYFTFSNKIAGLKNGALLMLENAFLQLFMIEQISEKFGKKRKWIGEIETYRKELQATFQQLYCINIPEIDLLERKVLKAMKVAKAKKELQNKLEQVEDSLVLKYNQRFNRLILWLTVVGTIVAVLSILNGIGVIPKI